MCPPSSGKRVRVAIARAFFIFDSVAEQLSRFGVRKIE
jgi:hypothetical protein